MKIPTADQLKRTTPASILSLASACVLCVERELESNSAVSADIMRSIQSAAALVTEMQAGGSHFSDSCRDAIGSIRSAVEAAERTGAEARVKADAVAETIKTSMEVQDLEKRAKMVISAGGASGLFSGMQRMALVSLCIEAASSTELALNAALSASNGDMSAAVRAAVDAVRAVDCLNISDKESLKELERAVRNATKRAWWKFWG